VCHLYKRPYPRGFNNSDLSICKRKVYWTVLLHAIHRILKWATLNITCYSWFVEGYFKTLWKKCIGNLQWPSFSCHIAIRLRRGIKILFEKPVTKRKYEVGNLQNMKESRQTLYPEVWCHSSNITIIYFSIPRINILNNIIPTNALAICKLYYNLSTHINSLT
jgi:hypothetical protein